MARRVGAERLALVFAVRDSDEGDALPFAGRPELHLDRLDETDAWALLTAASRARLDDVVRARIVAEARGNPLALLELPRSAATGPALSEPLVDRLVERGDRRRSTRKMLGLSESSVIEEGDTGRRSGLLGEARAVLVDGVEPTARIAALAALLYGSGTLPSSTDTFRGALR